MKSIKLKATASFPGAESKSATVEIFSAKLIKGWWSYDKEGEKIYIYGKDKIAIPLEETMYFHLETKDIENGQEVSLKLYEQDKNIFMTDWMDPDDNKFPEEEVTKKGIVKNDKVTIELVLQQSWESMIKDDFDNSFSLDRYLELYWEVTYKNISKELPENDEDYLRVTFSEKTLYFKTPTPSHNLPEFISNDGNPMLLMEFGKGFAKNKIIEKSLDIAKDKAQSQINNIVFAKLKKGHLVDNTGKVYTGKRLIHRYKEIYSNSSEFFENVEKGKNFTYTYQGTTHTTKGISQYDYFSKNGKRVTVLGAVKKLGNVFDIFNLVKTAGEDLDMSEPLPLDLGPLSPILDLAGVLVQQQKAEMDMWLEEVVQEEIDIAKLQGLEATRKAINSWNHNKEFKWDLMTISSETASKLLQGKFKTFDDFENFSLENRPDEYAKIEILYRQLPYDETQDKTNYIIETIFINE